MQYKAGNASYAAGINNSRISILELKPDIFVTVGATGNQTTNVYKSSTNNYIGAFNFLIDNESTTVTQIIVNEKGTVNAETNLSNLDLYYEVASPCNYDGNETLFGTAASFDSSQKATVTGSMPVGTSQVCLYAVLDVGSGATGGETIELEISDPSTDVTVSSGSVSGSSAIAISGTTTIQELVAGPQCGSADGQSFISAPTENLCSVGSASAVTGTGPWNWTCSLVSGYSKRKAITLSNSGSALTDYQVLVTLTYDSDMQADFDDIRFTSSDGTTELNYWLESKTDSTTANFWVKVPSVPNGNSTIYVYYSNASAESTSSGEDTFDLFTDFTTSIPSGWTTPTVSSYSGYTFENGDLVLYTGTRGKSKVWSGGNNTKYDTDVELNNKIIETRYKSYAEGTLRGTYTYRHLVIGLSSEDAISWYAGRHKLYNYWLTFTNTSASSLWSLTPWDGSLTGYNVLGFAYDGNYRRLYENYTLQGSYDATLPQSSSKIVLVANIGDANANGAAEGYYDWVRLRKYTSTEPSVSLGAEESISGGGAPASCSASKTISNDGVCGSADGQKFLIAPTTNLCINGTASILTGTGPWDWTCSVLGEFEDPTINGSFDGTWTGWSTSGGASTRIVNDTNPYSGIYNAYIYYNLTCAKEEIYQNIAVPNVSGTVNLEFWERTWFESWAGYAGIEINDSCVWCVSYGNAERRNVTTNWAKQTIDVSAYKGQTIKLGIVFHDTHPTYCVNSDHNGWIRVDEIKLVSSEGGLPLGDVASCSAMEGGVTNGVCGSSDGQTFTSIPTTNLCSSGIASDVSGTGPWNWTCDGYNDGPWYDNSWSKRKPITLTNSGSALTDYQVKLDITYDSDMQADFDDLRFTSGDGTTELSYWLESKTDSTSAIVWVKVPSIPNGDSTIYVYYGNGSVSTASSGDNTFVFFDDFLGSSIDTNKWTVDSSTGFSVGSGVLTGTNSTGRIRSVQTFGTGVSLEIKEKTTSLATNGHMIGGFWLSTTNGIGWLDHPTNWYYRNDSTWVNNSTAPVMNTYHRYIISSINSTQVYLSSYVYDTNANYWIPGTLSNVVSAESIMIGRRADGDSYLNQTYNAEWDWVFVRGYSSVVPTIVSGEEENITATNDSCSANILINGECGSADGGSYSTAPTENLCNPGIASSVISGSSFTWTCSPDVSNWLSGLYTKRKPITITNSDSALTDYQVKLDITYDSDMQADFDDLRFTSGDGTTELSYWLESKTDSTSAIVWVKVPSIPNGDSTIYVYYGNNIAITASSGANTFIQWHGYSNTNFHDENVASSPFVYEAKVNTFSNYKDWGTGSTTSSSSGDSVYLQVSTRYLCNVNDSSGNCSATDGSLNFNTVYRVKIILTSSYSELYIDNNFIKTYYTTVPDGLMGLASYNFSGGTGEQDWSFIRKYAATEPTTNGWGTEENSSAGTTDSCSATRTFSGPYATNLKSPLDINSNSSCWYCNEYLSAGNIVSGNSENLQFKFTYNDINPSALITGYQFAIGTDANVNNALITTTKIPVASLPVESEITYSSWGGNNISVKRSASSILNQIPYNQTYHWWVKVYTGDEFTDPIVNGSFDGTWTGWSSAGGASTKSVSDTSAYAGSYTSFIDYSITLVKEEIYQNITIPNVSGTINLDFWERTYFPYWAGPAGIKINDDWVFQVSGQVAGRNWVTTNWANHVIDVSAYKGQTVKLAIVWEDYYYGSDHYGWIRVDEIKLTRSGGTESANSDWIEAPTTFATPEHAFPLVRIVPKKTKLALNESTTLCTTIDVANVSDPCYTTCWTPGTGTPDLTSENWKCSVCYDSSNNPVYCSTENVSPNTFTWSLISGTGNLSALDAENPTLTATNIDTQFKSRLIITGSECGGEGGEIGGAAPLPKWKEINQ